MVRAKAVGNICLSFYTIVDECIKYFEQVNRGSGYDLKFPKKIVLYKIVSNIRQQNKKNIFDVAHLPCNLQCIVEDA